MLKSTGAKVAIIFSAICVQDYVTLIQRTCYMKILPVYTNNICIMRKAISLLKQMSENFSFCKKISKKLHVV